MFTRAKVLKNVVLTCPNDVFFEKYGDFVGKLTENAYFCPAFQKMHVKNGINIYMIYMKHNFYFYSWYFFTQQR